ncbi:MAG: SNF2 helicase associated domain-containing protein, partial [Clostridia bacterium]|nr:SNF2 helicase associated domain-containing protein [Clostridia bacterium]
MKITDKDIKKICSDNIFKAGMDYFREGRVHLRTRAEGQLTSAVDSDKVYNVHISFDDAGNIAETFCTCPYFQTMNANCKHIVATLKARQTELLSGEDFSDMDAKAAQDLCLEFEAISGEKAPLHAGFIFRINTNYRRECTYAVSITLGGSETPIAACESFLSALSQGTEYKLSKHKAFSLKNFYFNEPERTILDILAEAFQNKQGGSSVYTQTLTMTEFGSFTAKRLLPYLAKADCKFVVDGMIQPNLQILEDDPDILVDVTATDSGINISVPQTGIAVIPDGSWFFYEGDLYRTSEEWQKWFMPIYNALSVESRTQIDFAGGNSVNFAATVLPHLRGQKGVVLQGIENVVVDAKPRFDIYFDRFDDGISAVITASYGKISVRLPSDTTDHDKIVVRDFSGEDYILSFFEKFSEDHGTFYLTEDADVFEFLTKTLAKLSKLSNIHPSDSFSSLLVKDAPQIKNTAYYTHGIDLLEVGFSSDLTPAEIMGIMSAIRHKKPFFRTKDGGFLEIDEALSGFEILSNLDFSYNDIKDGKKALDRYNALYLAGLSENGKIEKNKEFGELIDRIRNLRARIPDYLDTVLRDYQKTGVHWMKQLSELGLGGILADDMGLGKTLEVIAFVMSENPQKPALVVTPSAVTYNWLSEINRFAPNAKAKIIDGTKEDRILALSDISGYDFIITSYPLLRRDILEYQEHSFSYCFIDEAQHIKNPKTLSAKAVKKIRAEKRFALSGTPIENSLSELWSIFDFIMPGHLFTHPQFLARFEKPITHGDDSASIALKGKIRPFILRRMKFEVLSELPDKIENTFFAELEPSQKKIYSAYLSTAKKEARELLEFGDKLRILSLLMRLRQICCHPALISSEYDSESGKLNLLSELTQNGINAGHRILIFSQFTSMLAIIKEKLDKAGISCFYLDGSTPSEERTAL